MAEFAGIARQDMITALALSSTAVVTGKTVTGNTAVIKAGHMPADRGMAVVALVITADMVHRLACGIGIVMTAVTQHGGSGELSCVVALVTLHIAMLAGEWESCREMIVIRGYR